MLSDAEAADATMALDQLMTRFVQAGAAADAKRAAGGVLKPVVETPRAAGRSGRMVQFATTAGYVTRNVRVGDARCRSAEADDDTETASIVSSAFSPSEASSYASSPELR